MTDYPAQLAEWEQVNKRQLANSQRPNWPLLLEIAKGLEIENQRLARIVEWDKRCRRNCDKCEYNPDHEGVDDE